MPESARAARGPGGAGSGAVAASSESPVVRDAASGEAPALQDTTPGAVAASFAAPGDVAVAPCDNPAVCTAGAPVVRVGADVAASSAPAVRGDVAAPSGPTVPDAASGEAPASQGASASAADPVLSPGERLQYEEDGFFVRERVFSPAEVEALCAALEDVVARAEALLNRGAHSYAIDGNRYVEVDFGKAIATVQLEHAPGSRTIRVIEPFHSLHPGFEALVDDARLAAPMCGLLNVAGVALFTDKLNMKRPGEGSAFRWHQDSPYWTHFCDHVDRLPNVLVALDDAHTGNGCFRVIRGTHKRGCLPGRQGEGVLGPLFTHPDYLDDTQQVPVEMAAGGAVFFSPHLVHGSQPNHSPEPRRALVLTYQPLNLPMFKQPGVRNVDVRVP